MEGGHFVESPAHAMVNGRGLLCSFAAGALPRKGPGGSEFRAVFEQRLARAEQSLSTLSLGSPYLNGTEHDWPFQRAPTHLS